MIHSKLQPGKKKSLKEINHQTYRKQSRNNFATRNNKLKKTKFFIKYFLGKSN